MLHCLTVVLELVAVSRSDGSRRHREEYLLSGFALQWPSEEERDESLLSGSFEPRNVIQTKMQMWRDRVYVVQSRYKPGVPFTLGVIDLDGEGTTEPTIQPYPDYESHGPGRSRNPWKRVNNVVDAYLDAKGLLWALDNGDSDEDGAVTRNAAKAKVFAVNVRTDEVIDNARSPLVFLLSLDTKLEKLRYTDVESRPNPSRLCVAGNSRCAKRFRKRPFRSSNLDHNGCRRCCYW